MEPNQPTSQPLPTPVAPPTIPPVEVAKTNKTMVYMVIFAAVIFIGLMLFFATQQNKVIRPPTNSTDSSTVRETAIPTVKPTKGTLSLIPKSGLAKYSLTQNVVLNLVADSSNEDISGYDALIGYDNTAFDFVSATSVIPDFKIFTFPKENYISVTATKNLQSSSPSIFTNTILIEITLKPKKVGNFTVSINEEQGRETTKFVNIGTSLVYPKLNNVSVEIN